MKISRRRFAQLLGATAAAAVARPALSIGKSTAPDESAAQIVRLSANENPYGPSPKALDAMRHSFGIACRYPDKHADALVEGLAKLNQVAPEQILLGDGSSEILKLCAETFTSPTAKLVAADPTFEALLKYSEAGGAEVAKIPLTATYAHDLERMRAAANAGLIYICNPNNPTASITPKKEVRDFLRQTPSNTMVLVDEAYFHYADSPDYESVIPLVADYPNLIVARTFSKVYGMAGLRCGYCVAQKAAIERMHARQPWDSVNIMGLVAALANLADPEQVAQGRRLTKEARSFTTGELEKMGYQTIPSQANFIMVDVKRPVVPLIAALKQRNVEVGRLFPALPDHMRVTIGKKSEMNAFIAAFRQAVA